ncbi:MAG: SDR family NAD(P)-dependent oxidoreductase [Pseudonocardiaceae bacterium]|nr:SDR family NAD(P)-dependent oxidoreductase [Pseudonocardiaceae bacterium]
MSPSHRTQWDVVPDGVVVVTGGASGIGRALAERFAREGARAVVVADLSEAAAQTVAAGLDCTQAMGIGLDVTDGVAVDSATERIEAELGAITLWCSNAGVALGDGLGGDDDWERSWHVHVQAHIHVARSVLPRMSGRGRGHLMITASAAGLLTNMDSAPYSVTKHGAVALAEWLAIRHGDAGIGVSCLCPQGVRTPMTDRPDSGSATRAAGGFLEPPDVADAVVAALTESRFLILPHPEVAEYERRRAVDRDRWLTGMRRMWAKISG